MLRQIHRKGAADAGLGNVGPASSPVVAAVILVAALSGAAACAPVAAAQQLVNLSGNHVAGERQVRGLVRPVSRISIRPALDVAIANVRFRAGEPFAKGDTLLEHDCSEIDAALGAADASEHAARIEHDSKRRLFKRGAAGKDEVSLAEAALKRAGAEKQMKLARAQKCTVTAPYDGRVVEVAIEPMEMPEPGKPMMIIVDDRNLELELVAPSHWLTWLKPGLEFPFTIDEGGMTVTARVERLGAEIDPVSQTVRVIARLDGVGERLIPGMSGAAQLAKTN
ncbi:MAG: HlyD family efflux transporter periplasmic adaptor subunit [Rhizobiaceae bacterium]